ncbi:MAG TPA: FAD-binding and (Fe-S)-binding domain-containing protein, partial [Thermoanaerobaculia bacterium]
SDRRELARRLAREIRGEVRFDDGSLALYATDASNYRQVPIGVVLPKDRDDLIAAIGVCRALGAPIVSRGGGTSLAGQACNAAVVIDTSKYFHHILQIDPERRRAIVEPGVILNELNRAASRHGLTFGPDPASRSQCTLGGMIGNDSCGVHSVMAAFAGEGPKTADNVAELEVLTYDGARLRVGKTTDEELSGAMAAGGRRAEIYRGLAALRDLYAPLIRSRYPDIPRRVSGYNLPYLLPEKGMHVARALVGSEGTCVTVLEATLQLIESPAARALCVAGFPDVVAAAQAVPQILTYRPIGLEGFDDRLVADTRTVGANAAGLELLPRGNGWLVIETGGTTSGEARARALKLEIDLRRTGAVDTRVYADAAQQASVWSVRESALGVTSHVPGRQSLWEGWEDSAVPPEKLGDYMRGLRALLERYGFEGAFYGHFGQGCLHTRINFDFHTSAGIGAFRAFLDDAADLVLAHGGSLSGEHGDGQARAELLPKMFGTELVEAFREFKRLWDPQGKMNPGKVVDAYAITDHLRLSADSSTSAATQFRYPADQGDLGRALERCVGVGKCRRLDGGAMCPSFMVTREEAHSTRGRAHLLFEMLRGETIRGGWRDRRVKEALDLCLACKACKTECPVSVDVATYKAEFLSHFYAGRLRPRAAYAMGLVHRWAHWGSRAPGLANWLTQTPGISAAIRRLAGISPDRNLPEIAPQTFRSWFSRRERPGPAPRGSSARSRSLPESSGRRVLLWPDTFSNYFQPETARAAVEVLESAGFEVALPIPRLCCGRPLYDFGMLGLARNLLIRALDALREEVRRGTPIVVLEPSCASVFRDELPNLLADDPDAARLAAQIHLLDEFLGRHPDRWPPGRLGGRALLQVHCHQKSLRGSSSAQMALERLGLGVEQPNEGCCGMAGAFGYEASHSAISLQIAGRALTPALRLAPEGTLLVADGFSCRQQIHHLTGRLPLHFAQVLHRAMAAGS